MGKTWEDGHIYWFGEKRWEEQAMSQQGDFLSFLVTKGKRGGQWLMGGRPGGRSWKRLFICYGDGHRVLSIKRNG